MERTLVIIKPDGVQRGLVGPILTRFEQRGLKIAAMKLLKVSDELAYKHYAVHEGKPFFAGLIKYITSAPVVVMVLEGKNAIQAVRTTVGVTRPHEAAAGTIRADFALDISNNLVHASDGPETAKTEIGVWFTSAELVDYSRVIDAWIAEA